MTLPVSAILAVATATIVALIHPPVWAIMDDTTILEQAQKNGLSSLFMTYAGYLGVIHRAVALLEAPAPLLIGAFGSYLAVAAVALFLVRRVHPAAVLALILAPAVNVYGTLSNIQWVLAVYLVGMLLATPPTSTRGRMIDALGVFTCGLTGPFSILLLPLYVVRAINPVWRWHLVVLAAAAAIQVMALTMSYRPPGSDHDTLTIMVARAAVPIGLILLSALRLPLAWVVGALYVAVIIPILGITAIGITTADFLSGAGERYFYLPWVVGLGLALLALRPTFAQIRRPFE